MKISENILQKLRCPSTKASLQKNGEYLESVIDPAIRYPIIDGIPILIDNEKSLFSINDFKQKVNSNYSPHPTRTFSPT